jgi:hypothetical protein
MAVMIPPSQRAFLVISRVLADEALNPTPG